MTSAPGLPGRRSPSDRIALLISDVDGTLVTPAKELTPAAVRAVAALRAAGIGFTAVSSRPPRGLGHVLPALAPDLPFGGFNGGSLVDPHDGTILEQRSLPEAVARETLALFAAAGVGAWVFDGTEWLLDEPGGPYVGLERHTIGFEPRPVASFGDVPLRAVGKIVGVSADAEGLARCELGLRARLAGAASVLRSQPYYLDVTHPDATKGNFLLALSRRLGVAPDAIAAIGDGDNDVSMFREAGLAVAMGNASDAVKAEADLVTAPNSEDGFAEAVRRFILPRA